MKWYKPHPARPYGPEMFWQDWHRLFNRVLRPLEDFAWRHKFSWLTIAFIGFSSPFVAYASGFYRWW